MTPPILFARRFSTEVGLQMFTCSASRTTASVNIFYLILRNKLSPRAGGRCVAPDQMIRLIAGCPAPLIRCRPKMESAGVGCVTAHRNRQIVKTLDNLASYTRVKGIAFRWTYTVRVRIAGSRRHDVLNAMRLVAWFRWVRLIVSAFVKRHADRMAVFALRTAKIPRRTRRPLTEIGSPLVLTALPSSYGARSAREKATGTIWTARAVNALSIRARRAIRLIGMGADSVRANIVGTRVTVVAVDA